MSSKIVATKLTHSSTLDFLLEVLGLGFSDSAGSGEPGGSVGGLGAFSTSGSGSRGMEGPFEAPENNKNIRVDTKFAQKSLVPNDLHKLNSLSGFH